MCLSVLASQISYSHCERAACRRSFSRRSRRRRRHNAARPASRSVGYRPTALLGTSLSQQRHPHPRTTTTTIAPARPPQLATSLKMHATIVVRSVRSPALAPARSPPQPLPLPPLLHLGSTYAAEPPSSVGRRVLCSPGRVSK